MTVSPPIALVSGANRGLGRGISLALARSGHRIVATHRPGGDASDTVRAIEAIGAEAIAIPLDISRPRSFAGFRDDLRDSLVSTWGSTHLDVLVNNAGIGHFGAVEDVTIEEFDALFDTNVRGAFFLTQAMLDIMSRGGHIINVSSSLSRHVSPATSAYAASKAALETLGRSLALELGPRGIRVNTVAPGPTGTDFNGGAMRDDEHLRDAIASRSALGRVGEPYEIGDAVAALASASFRWVTGERLEVSGGAFL
ncbi:MAG: SDR family oxidoreductase [Microbacterium sp.]